jgi:hypothetical protein
VELTMRAHAGIAAGRVQTDHSPKPIDLVIRAGHRWS